MPPPAFIAHVRATAHDLGLGAIRSRAITTLLGSRLHHLPSCFSDDDYDDDNGNSAAVVRSLSRAYYARAQPLTARRTRVAIDDDEDSVREMQVYRHPPPPPSSSSAEERVGEEEEEERWVARNRDPYRDEEYLSYSSTSWGDKSRSSRAGAEDGAGGRGEVVVVVVGADERRDAAAAAAAAAGGERRRRRRRRAAATAAIREHDAEQLERWLGGGERDFGFSAVVTAAAGGGRRNAISVAREPVVAACQDGGSGRSDGDDGR
ncbi:MAG: hypothetical protein LQ345_006270, partial [Seirophora villosa]